jgi:hypothetical protein
VDVRRRPGQPRRHLTCGAQQERADRPRNLKGSNAYFDETEIAGYPAVHTAVVDYRNEGQCGLFVGVTDQLAVQIFTELDHGPGVTNSCPVADKVGAAMIETLKKG